MNWFLCCDDGDIDVVVILLEFWLRALQEQSLSRTMQDHFVYIPVDLGTLNFQICFSQIFLSARKLANPQTNTPLQCYHMLYKSLTGGFNTLQKVIMVDHNTVMQITRDQEDVSEMCHV